jgi:hypothetical protein
MTAAAVLARAQAAGLRLQVTRDGKVKVQADGPPPDALLDELREWRDDIARLLTAQGRRSEPGTSFPDVLVGNDGDPERQALAQRCAAPPSPRPYLPSDRDDYRDGLRISALMRPSAWPDPAPPPRGAWCSCCGRSNPKAGGRWWQPRHPRTDGLGLGPGWRCMTCHPPPPGAEVEVVQT